ncbi:hypothetical protein BDN70DRAFT_934788 [Pholiota conissans]|uniref:C2H2-type domain-containing protein n=1 Tax=Pholiota conissans TaxID=109636 RepID=A0A9P6CS03_9AGAR|nr:hypothetical protein BDN70DRAFT_934788 [Pholiota conissans]
MSHHRNPEAQTDEAKFKLWEKQVAAMGIKASIDNPTLASITKHTEPIASATTTAIAEAMEPARDLSPLHQAAYNCVKYDLDPKLPWAILRKLEHDPRPEEIPWDTFRYIALISWGRQFDDTGNDSFWDVRILAQDLGGMMSMHQIFVCNNEDAPHCGKAFASWNMMKRHQETLSHCEDRIASVLLCTFPYSLL